MNNFLLFLKSFGITPKNEQIFLRAFTHSSFKLKEVNAKDYERLEFLGDAVLGFVIASSLFKHYPNENQGTLTLMRKSFVQGPSFAAKARALNFGEHIRVGNSINKEELMKNDKYFEDVFEAFIGATYLDQGITFAQKLILEIFEEEIKAYDFGVVSDYKSTLQEYVQSDKRGDLEYVAITSGPANAPTFHVSVKYDGIVLGEGVGKRLKEAEQLAAKKALEKVAK